MNCPDCGVNLTNLEEHEYRDQDGIHRTVWCNPEMGGCNYRSSYVKRITSTIIVLNETRSKPRQGRIHANVAGSKEVKPCTCSDDHEAIAYAMEHYLKESKMIPECPDCGNHQPLARSN